MKHEIIDIKGLQIIGMAKEIEFRTGGAECPKFWAEYVERIVKPVFMEGKEPDEFQKAAQENNIGEFGLCTCDIPGHSCMTCAAVNFTACNTKTFTYVIGGIYKGGNVPEGMRLFPVPDGKWLKMHFEDGCSMEWYAGTDISTPDYQCGIMVPIE